VTILRRRHNITTGRQRRTDGHNQLMAAFAGTCSIYNAWRFHFVVRPVASDIVSCEWVMDFDLQDFWVCSWNIAGNGRWHLRSITRPVGIYGRRNWAVTTFGHYTFPSVARRILISIIKFGFFCAFRGAGYDTVGVYELIIKSITQCWLFICYYLSQGPLCRHYFRCYSQRTSRFCVRNYWQAWRCVSWVNCFVAIFEI